MADIYWPGEEAPVGELEFHVRKFLEDYDGGRIHRSYAQPFLSQYAQVDYLFRIIYIFEGKLVMTSSFDGKIQERVIRAGELFVGGKGHWDRINAPHCTCRALSIIFTDFHIRLLYTQFVHGALIQQPYCHLAYESPQLERLSDVIDGVLLAQLRMYGLKDYEDILPLLIRALVLELLNESRRLKAPDLSAYPECLKKVIFYMQTNFSSYVTCSQICDDLHMNRSHISSLFKRYTGMNMKDYLLKLRMEKSRKLLLNYRTSIGIIAEDCGFMSAKYFIECFRKYYGMTPGAFRREKEKSALEKQTGLHDADREDEF